MRFARLWTGTTASGLATWALPFVLGLGVVDGSLSAVELGLALGVRTAGFLVAVPISGVLADRYSRRATVGWSGAAAALGTVLVAAGLGQLAVLLVGAALAGAGQGACRPAFQALVAEVVPQEKRQSANAAITVAVRATTLIAPALTALLATVVEIGWLALGIALLWVVAAAVPPRGIVRSRDPERLEGAARDSAGRATARFLADFREGLVEARRHPWFLAGLGALTAVIATGYSATGVALPLVSAEVYGGATVLAAALTGYTVGALLGGLLIARIRPRAPGRAALAGLAVYAVAPLALLSELPVWVVVGAYVVCGIGIELFNVPWFTAVQREVAPDKLARVSSLDFLFSYGLAPLGLALIAPAIATFGVSPVLVACAVVCVVAPALAMLAPGARGFATAEVVGRRS
ncbi:MFS transporter [Pseudonocardia oroxyli]|uniref:Predicted arabinose efflux permease, MFS family n=1 Tax=Pseudonocardia oroxyli TaxID=366584 RepID=A0A1G7UVU5_PSEOR|nr:MFS transporter [Pseudonocardia oroxyli]SDG51617.1 Predicted arabinose efflux permease, MFS family [Pseudonocardia oroxyli]